MSHYTTVELEVKDRQSFVEALADVWPRALPKGAVEVHDVPQNLKGFQGDTREQKAHIIVRRKHVGGAANDIGFHFDGNKATAFISEYDRGRYTSAWEGKLMQRYARNVAVKEAKRKGYRVKESVTEDGKVKLLLER